jgi:superfamily II DNA/RNA helicase
MKFSSLPLISSLQENLKTLEYTQATDIQEKAIPLILAGNDVMARAKTGTGKTAAFALPILNNLLVTPNRATALSVLVLAPTRELVQQIYTNFNQYSINTDLKVAAVFGGVSIKPQVSNIAEGVEVLIATRGR